MFELILSDLQLSSSLTKSRPDLDLFSFVFLDRNDGDRDDDSLLLFSEQFLSLQLSSVMWFLCGDQ